MRKPIFYRSALLLVISILLSCVAVYAEETNENLKRECLAATLTAINMEIDRCNKWIELRKAQGDTEDLSALQKRLAELKADYERYSAMDVADYVLPEKVTAVAWVERQAGNGSILYVENMSKRGPWYHLSGLIGGDYTALQAKTRYHLTFYPVYRRDYGGMDSAYVYVADGFSSSHKEVKEGQEKRFMGEVFAKDLPMPVSKKVKCEKYQIYLLKENQPGAKGKLVLDSNTSKFDFTLSEEMLEQYSYLEFVSDGWSKTIKISEITDEPLEIVLQPQYILKKPAIYLYPTQRSQIVVTHNFKGQILNTYPAYDGNWTVVAEPNGDLYDVRDHRNYKYLFWDGAFDFPTEHYQFIDGFYVNSQDYVQFLQSKLAAIGLNENEINDFIVYWLPAMNKYKNCFVHFRINDNIDGSSELTAKPAPNTTIRVFMEFSGMNDLGSVMRLPEQKLPSFIRKGFTLVEWGGAEIGAGRLE